MNAEVRTDRSAPTLAKADPATPALVVTGPLAIAIKAGTILAGMTFAEETPVTLPSLTPGTDYAVVVSSEGQPGAVTLPALPLSSDVLGGFHFAPGGNAAARRGGDDVPAINPFSAWDLNFRPACLDPRGMTLVETLTGKFWCDIYLTGVGHKAKGTSVFGATIADGNDLPEGLTSFDYEAATGVMAEHGKGLLSFDEFVAAAYGVTEKTACGKDPKRTSLDAPRTSKWGVMQATGNLWVWGHDGDPDVPRASFFGGYWWGGDSAGSRHARVACHGPVASLENFGARGRSDHLKPA